MAKGRRWIWLLAMLAALNAHAGTPYFRFSDGTIALLSEIFLLKGNSVPNSCVTFLAPKHGKVIWGDYLARTSIEVNAARNGYVVLGNPMRYVIGRQVFVQDKSLPPWIGKAIRQATGKIAQLYSSELGARELPDILAFATKTKQAQSTFHGDTLPASITLDFSGEAWAKPEGSALGQPIGLVAHELFHVWNADKRAPGRDKLLALEGGAELARELAERRFVPGHRPVLRGVSDALNRCRSALDPQRSLKFQLISPGQLPYSCGMPFMLAAVSAGRGSMTLQNAFFAAWKSALINAPREDYRWEGLVARDASPSVLADLRRAISVPGAYERNLRKVLLAAGYQVSFERDLTKAERMMAAGKLMREIMVSDCHGEASFYWKRPEGFLVAPLPTSGVTCASLSPNEIVTKIDGALPWARPIALSERVARACAKRGYVAVSLAGRQGTRQLACSNSVRAIARPVVVSQLPWHAAHQLAAPSSTF
jgi:hypothetical protein